VTVEEWERFRDDWGRIDTDSELKFKARVFYGVKNIVTIVLFCALKLYSCIQEFLVRLERVYLKVEYYTCMSLYASMHYYPWYQVF
jgi:hypothetical protein